MCYATKKLECTQVTTVCKYKIQLPYNVIKLMVNNSVQRTTWTSWALY